MAVVVNEFEVVPQPAAPREAERRPPERPASPRPEELERQLRARAERAARLEAT